MTELNEDNYIEKIMSYTASDWEPLLNFIPILESHRRLFEDADDDEEFEGPEYGTYYYRIPSQVIYKFQEVVELIPIIIDFDWILWDECWDIMFEDNYDLTFDMDTIDIPTKCKIITTLIENERMDKYGIIQEVFKNGFIFLLLKSLKEQLRALNIIDY